MWLVSYILILLVPIIFSFFSYYYAENSLSQKINETNVTSLKSAQTYMDNILGGIVSATVTLSSNNDIMALAAKSELPSSTQMYERNIAISDSNKVWRAHSIFGDFITSKYIYLPNTDTIYTVSILVDSEYFFTQNYPGSLNFDTDKCQQLLQRERPGFVCLPISGNTEMFYVYPTYNNKTDVQFYTIVHLNMTSLTKIPPATTRDTFLYSTTTT